MLNMDSSAVEKVYDRRSRYEAHGWNAIDIRGVCLSIERDIASNHNQEANNCDPGFLNRGRRRRDVDISLLRRSHVTNVCTDVLSMGTRCSHHAFACASRQMRNAYRRQVDFCRQMYDKAYTVLPRSADDLSSFSKVNHCQVQLYACIYTQSPSLLFSCRQYAMSEQSCPPLVSTPKAKLLCGCVQMRLQLCTLLAPFAA